MLQGPLSAAENLRPFVATSEDEVSRTSLLVKACLQPQAMRLRRTRLKLPSLSSMIPALCPQCHLAQELHPGIHHGCTQTNAGIKACVATVQSRTGKGSAACLKSWACLQEVRVALEELLILLRVLLRLAGTVISKVWRVGQSPCRHSNLCVESYLSSKPMSVVGATPKAIQIPANRIKRHSKQKTIKSFS